MSASRTVNVTSLPSCSRPSVLVVTHRPLHSSRGASRRLIALLIAAAALSVGCGGGPSPEQRFAADVCSIALSWADETLVTYDEVRLTRAAPGSEARLEALGLVQTARREADSYAAKLGAVPAPEGDTGKRAKELVGFSADGVLAIMVDLERYVRRMPDEPTLIQSIRALEHVEFELLSAVNNVKLIATPITLFLPEFREAFDGTAACAELKGLRNERHRIVQLVGARDWSPNAEEAMHSGDA